MTSSTTDEILQRLRDGKVALRAARRSMTLAEKVREVVRLQRVALPLIRQRRELRAWERVWPLDDVTNHSK